MPRGEQVQGNQMEVRRLKPRQGNTFIGLDLGQKPRLRRFLVLMAMCVDYRDLSSEG